MCVVSMIGDAFKDRWGPRYPEWYPNDIFAPGLPGTPKTQKQFDEYLIPKEFYKRVSREEFEIVKREVEILRDLLIRGKEYDEKNKEPNCEMEEKIAFLRKVAKDVGVDLDEVFGK